jgi:hypothetical protein
MQNGLKDFISKSNFTSTFTDAEIEYMSYAGLTKTEEYNSKVASDPNFSTNVNAALNRMKTVSKDCK